MISIYEYTDYRCFLRDRFLELKGLNPYFSYRAFNQKAGIRSSAFLKLVIDGKRNLGEEGMRKVAKGLKLEPEEAQYLEKLVQFNQADLEEKDECFRDLSEFKPFLRAQGLTAAQYRLFSQWYSVAILEVLRLEAGELKDEHWLQRQLYPSVGLREVQRAIKELKSLGLIEEDAQGALTRREAMLSTPDEVQSLFVIKYHQEMSALASRAVAAAPAELREFSGLTISVSAENLAKAKQEIQKFRQRLHSLLEQEETGVRRQVIQINLQLFPLSQYGKGTL